MTSILEPFLSKRSPNETGTCSVYANVNVVKNVENNEDDVFTIKDDTAETSYNIKAPTVIASQIKITSSNTEIDNDNKNAVNKSYCDSNYIRKVNPLTLDQISALSISLRTPFGDVPIGTSYYNYTDDNGVIQGVPAAKINGGNFFYNDRAYFTNPISIYGTRNIEFNTNAKGQIAESAYPQGKLSNLVTSTITSAQMSSLITNNLLDNVCPTYLFTENTYLKGTEAETIYLKKSDAESTYAKKSDIVQTTGTSTTNIMSQKAITDQLQILEDKIPFGSKISLTTSNENTSGILSLEEWDPYFHQVSQFSITLTKQNSGNDLNYNTVYFGFIVISGKISNPDGSVIQKDQLDEIVEMYTSRVDIYLMSEGKNYCCKGEFLDYSPSNTSITGLTELLYLIKFNINFIAIEPLNNIVFNLYVREKINRQLNLSYPLSYRLNNILLQKNKSFLMYNNYK